MAKCYKCGTIYDGWSCPTCSVEEKLKQQEEDLQSSMEESAEELLQAIKESTEKQKKMLEEQRYALESTIEEAQSELAYAYEKTTSEAWKLQASAKADRAYELLAAGLYRTKYKSKRFIQEAN